jgi:carbamoyltransferase
LVIDGDIVAAAQEERFSRIKHDHAFPLNATRYCLSEANLTAAQLDYVCFYDKPLLKLDRLLETYLDYSPAGFTSFLKSMPLWMKEKLWMPDLIRTELAKTDGEEDERKAKKVGKKFEWKLLFGDHHESHAASAFYPSPFEEAAVLTIDGVGEWATSSMGIGKGHELTLLKELRYPDSLGLLYSAFTYYTGFKVNSGEYKVMGLAPYGEPKFVEAIRNKLVEVRDDGSIRMNHEYFSYSQGLRMTNSSFDKLFGGPPRKPESRLTQREMDLARSIQVITEEVMLKMAHYAHRETRMKNLCLAGGVALNCVANGRVLREVPFESIWIQPAAGDAGGALGIALAVWHRYLDQPRQSPESKGTWQSDRGAGANGLKPYADGMKGSYLGPRNTEKEIATFLSSVNSPFKQFTREELPGVVAELLSEGKVIGLHQGRMEFGPRALGGRSIIGDPRSAEMQSVMNLKIKFRESFRPFAPVVLQEYVDRYFDMRPFEDSPYMLLVAPVVEKRRTPVSADQQNLWGIDLLNVPKSDIPAVTHIDYSARIQTVHEATNPRYYGLLKAFEAKTGCGVIVNTSFNVRGEPIVGSPADAYRCFMRTEMDLLVLENCVLEKAQQKPLADDSDWRKEFELD